MFGILPVSKRDQLAVRSAFSCVLSRRLAIHLKDAAAGLSNQAADQMNVVDLNRRCSCLHRLVDALKNGRNKHRCGADRLGSLLKLAL